MRGGPIAVDIDAYIAAAPAAVQPLLRQMRKTIAKAAPDAVEAIVYAIPTFRLHGNLVHFAAFAKHIGFYPGPGAITKFAAELTPYVTSKGAIQFPLNAPLPLALVAKITAYRVASSTELAAAKAARKRAEKAFGAQRTAARKSVATNSATATRETPKPPTQKSTTRKSTTKKSPTKKSPTKKSAVTKTAPARRTPR